MLRSTFIPPCEPTSRDRLPNGEGWFYEVMHDGYRMQVHNAGRRVTLYTKNGADWTERFPHLTTALASWLDPPSSTLSSCTPYHVLKRNGFARGVAFLRVFRFAGSLLPRHAQSKRVRVNMGFLTGAEVNSLTDDELGLYAAGYVDALLVATIIAVGKFLNEHAGL